MISRCLAGLLINIKESILSYQGLRLSNRRYDETFAGEDAKKATRADVLSNSYTMGCPPVRLDNPRALASGLSYVQVDKHGITILYHLHQCRPCTS